MTYRQCKTWTFNIPVCGCVKGVLGYQRPFFSGRVIFQQDAYTFCHWIRKVLAFRVNPPFFFWEYVLSVPWRFFFFLTNEAAASKYRQSLRLAHKLETYHLCRAVVLAIALPHWSEVTLLYLKWLKIAHALRGTRPFVAELHRNGHERLEARGDSWCNELIANFTFRLPLVRDYRLSKGDCPAKKTPFQQWSTLKVARSCVRWSKRRTAFGNSRHRLWRHCAAGWSLTISVGVRMTSSLTQDMSTCTPTLSSPLYFSARLRNCWVKHPYLPGVQSPALRLAVQVFVVLVFVNLLSP